MPGSSHGAKSVLQYLVQSDDDQSETTPKQRNTRSYVAKMKAQGWEWNPEDQVFYLPKGGLSSKQNKQESEQHQLSQTQSSQQLKREQSATDDSAQASTERGSKGIKTEDKA